MKKLASFLLGLGVALGTGVLAQIQINQLPPATLPLASTDQTIISQGPSGFTRRAPVSAFTGTPGPPLTAAYILQSANGTIPNSRTLVGTANEILLADGGPLGNLVLSTPQAIATTNSPTFAGLTLTAPLTVPNGGTGLGTLTLHGLLLGEGTANVGSVAAMAVDTLLQGQGATLDPAATAVPNCGSGTQALSYSTGTHLFGCQTIAAGAPASPTNSIQFNNAGAFGGSAALLFDGTSTVTLGSTTAGTLVAPAGAIATSAGATLTVRGGPGGATSGNGGAVTVTGGIPATLGAGGAVNIAGAAAVGAARAGGNVAITGGAPTTTGAAGAISIVASNSGTTATGGAVTITAGNGGSTSGSAGAINITGGASGSAAGTGFGGSVFVRGGNNSLGTAVAGDVTITSGVGSAGGLSGNVNIGSDSGVLTLASNSSSTLTGGAASLSLNSGLWTLASGTAGSTFTGTNGAGIQLGSPTGGDKGAGTINTSGLFVSGTTVIPVSGTYTATATGCTTAPTETITYTVIGVPPNGIVNISGPGLSCTSNATTFTLTGAPAAITPLSTGAGCRAQPMASATNNGIAAVTPVINMNTSGTLVLQNAGSTTGWTAAGAKADGLWTINCSLQ